MNYYNDNDPSTSEWLTQLITDNLIPEGTVDGRSILEVKPNDLTHFRQCHFFAGIGGWAEALRLAGVPHDFRVWTGSPPCQPFSAAGRQLGADDPRHLGPRFVDLVRACRPPLLFGEQVASSTVIGRASKSNKHQTGEEPEWSWIDDLFNRLEAAGYATWAGVIPAAGVGAPHIRQRTFFGAADLHWLVNGLGEGLERLGWNGDGQTGRQVPIGSAGASSVLDRTNPTNGFWGHPDWLLCRDGKWRPTQSSVFSVVDGLPNNLVSGSHPLAENQECRVMRLRGYGNAIVPQAAAHFIQSSLDMLHDLQTNAGLPG